MIKMIQGTESCLLQGILLLRYKNYFLVVDKERLLVFHIEGCQVTGCLFTVDVLTVVLAR